MSDYANEGYANEGYELGWDAEIENEGTPFVVAEPGDYGFTVTGFERARFAGSAKMPPCNQAKLFIKLDMPNGEECVIKHNLFLHSKTEWKLCEFFTAIGQRKHGQKVSMNWNAVQGAHGRCKVSKRSFKSKEGKEMWTNDIDKFYEPSDELPFTVGTSVPQQPTYQTPSYPQQPAQPTYQQPAQSQPIQAASNYTQAVPGNGYVPGKF